jgi:hypothetical protein
VPVTGALQKLAEAWRERVGGASRRALLLLLLAALLGGAHLARIGTAWTRTGAAGLLLLSLLLLLARWVRERRDWSDVRRTIRRVLVPTDRGLAQRTLRAVSLVQRTGQDPSAGSPDLARLHYERLLARASLKAVERSAERRALGWRWAGLGLLGAAIASVAVGPFQVIEGLDVLVAHDGRAPLSLPWLEYVRVTADPPAYLRSSARLLFPDLAAAQPEGSVVVIRGVPLRQGRHLVLTDGQREVPFADDGSGGVVARWKLQKSAQLEVAARFGDVLITEPDSLDVRATRDRTPVVHVEGAPKTLHLADVKRLPIRYTASDDHGLRQIDLVLRAGDREDRRVLGRFDGDSTFESGGYALTPRDPFLRRMFLPVVVTVEARDNDPLHGPKWGKSAAITLVPPAVGEPEAKRYAALRGARDSIVDLLAWQLEPPDKPTAAERRERVRQEHERAQRAADTMRDAVDGTYGGLTVFTGLRSFLLGQMRILVRPRRPGESMTQRTEDVLLAVDVALGAVSARDARTVSKRLGDVAEEAAGGARQALDSEKRDQGVRRLDAAILALGSGSRQLVTLGALGRDIGSVALADLGRIERARKHDDMTHAELAALHLAQRLRRPAPSFATAGGGGVESGEGGQGRMSGKASQADDRFNELENELEQLAQEHAGGIAGVQQSLSDAEHSVDLESIRKEAEQHAEAIRRAVQDLPLPGAEPGSARAAAALGREQAGAMAQSLERLSLQDAVKSGRDAIAALDDAARKAKDGRLPTDWLDGDVAGARKRLSKQLAWAEKQLDKLKRKAEARAESKLDGAGDKENSFARRAGNLAGRGKNGETAFPQDSIESLERAESIMREAARALSQGKGDKGLALQRQAQRLLERARTGQTTDPEDSSSKDDQRSHDGTEGRGMRTGGEVPPEGKAREAEDFRKRVLEGLGRDKGGRLSPAVRRYAEGLLQ